MTIMYLTFGQNIEYHVQAYLSMLSFRKQTAENDHIVMVTTNPEFYRHARNWVDIIAVNDDQVQLWKGPHQYIFRVKTMAIRQLIKKYPQDHLIFVDTDTVLVGDLQVLRELMDQGTGLMHRNEGHPSQMKGPSRKMWRTINGHTYNGITLTDRHCMWNSGIIGMPREKMEQIVSDTLVLLDGMLDEGVKSFNIEQYAISVAMQTHVQMSEAYQYVGHYWGNKQGWQKLAVEVLLRSYMQENSLEEELELIDDELMQRLPVYIHHSNTSRRLKKFITRLFPDKGHQYVKSNIPKKDTHN